MVADSTSRWAEALREVGGRLGEMPVEEGYPAYLSSRLAAFYERAGRIETQGGRRGSVTLIGAVSPPGGDFSEPVTAHTKDIVETFWALSKPLADARHYPAVDWNDSFSGYASIAARWWSEEVSPEWSELRSRALALLAQADELTRIVNLVGPEALSPPQRWALEGADMVKQGVLQQSALDPVDSYCPPAKQVALLQAVLTLYRSGQELLELGIPVQELLRLPQLTDIRRLKNLAQKADEDPIAAFNARTAQAVSDLREEYMRQREITE
jgi:V/A-type H+-transporting ATPase subunit A